jgi:hypothetical protein
MNDDFLTNEPESIPSRGEGAAVAHHQGIQRGRFVCIHIYQVGCETDGRDCIAFCRDSAAGCSDRLSLGDAALHGVGELIEQTRRRGSESSDMGSPPLNQACRLWMTLHILEKKEEKSAVKTNTG